MKRDLRRHDNQKSDTQHYDIHQNNTQHNGTQNNNNKKCRSIYCHLSILSTVMLNAVYAGYCIF